MCKHAFAWKTLKSVPFSRPNLVPHAKPRPFHPLPQSIGPPLGIPGVVLVAPATCLRPGCAEGFSIHPHATYVRHISMAAFRHMLSRCAPRFMSSCGNVCSSTARRRLTSPPGALPAFPGAFHIRSQIRSVRLRVGFLLHTLLDFQDLISLSRITVFGASTVSWCNALDLEDFRGG